VFDLSIGKLLILGILALMIFGPERLPKVAAQAGRALRDLRRIAESAKSDLQEGLGPEFRDFDINDLNPKTFVRKHLWEEFEEAESAAAARRADGDPPSADAASAGTLASASAMPQASGPSLAPGERPPFDAEAT
jgi:sec-independent protein translocase protein TatB